MDIDSIIESEEYDALIKAGFPTFQQFCKNPTKWLGHENDTLNMVDRGSSHLSAYKIDTTYRYGKYSTKKLEEIERMWLEEGHDKKKMKAIPRTVDQTANTIKIVVEFVLKPELNQHVEVQG